MSLVESKREMSHRTNQTTGEHWKWCKLTRTRAKSVKRLIMLSERRLEFISNK